MRIETMRSGYFHNPAMTVAAFIDGWYQTGDQSPLTETGRLTYSATFRTILPRGRGRWPSSISCATRAAASGKTVPTVATSAPVSIEAAICVRHAVVTSTRKKAALIPRVAAIA